MFTKLLNKTNNGKDFTLTTGNTDNNVSNALLVQTVLTGWLWMWGHSDYGVISLDRGSRHPQTAAALVSLHSVSGSG